MALTAIDISKGVFKTQDSRTLRNAPFADNLVNMFLDRAGANYDRPTLEAFATLSSTGVIGAYYFKGLILAITTDRKAYSISQAGTVTDVTGTTLDGIQRPTFADNGSTVFIAGGGAPLKWNGLGNTTALLGGSPPDMTHVVYLDDYVIGNRRLESENNKVIQFSNLADSETWTGTDIFSAVADRDEVQGIATSQRELYVVGEETTEVWQNIGTSPVPFARAFVYQHGTPARYSIVSADNSVFIIDQNRRILRMAGRQVSRVSEGIEEILASYSTVADAWGGFFAWDGSIHVYFGFPTAGAGWSLDLKNQQWSEWRGYSNGWAAPQVNCLIYLEDVQQVFAGDPTTADLWKFSATTKTDAGGIFVVSAHYPIATGAPRYESGRIGCGST